MMNKFGFGLNLDLDLDVLKYYVFPSRKENSKP